jgi:hypothetical protein
MRGPRRASAASAGLGAVAMLLLSGCPDESCEPGWAPLLEDLDRSVLSGAARGDGVYLAGGSLGDPGGALAFHWDGDGWRELPTDRDQTLWWVWPAPAASSAEPDSGAVWFVGEEGLVLRWDGAAFTAIESGTTATLYGVWGSADDDVWIVGGTPGARPGEDDVILHWDGTALSRDSTAPARGAAMFKSWGSGADDLWVSGEGGSLLHRTAAGWSDESAQLDTPASILTIHGCSADEIYATGGQTLYAYDGTAWRARTDVEILGTINGVSCGPAGVLVVGNAGFKLRWDRATDTWHDEQLQRPWDTDFHGALVAPGGLWALGGNFQLPAGLAPRVGVVGFSGCPRPSSDAP